MSCRPLETLWKYYPEQFSVKPDEYSPNQSPPEGLEFFGQLKPIEKETLSTYLSSEYIIDGTYVKEENARHLALDIYSEKENRIKPLIESYVESQLLKIKTVDKKQYTGTIQAPAVDGIYSLKIYVYDQLNRLYVIDSAAGLTVHSSPPQVTLLFPQRLVSPNNDNVNDYIQFFPELVKAIRLENWRIEIVDEGDNIVRSEEGFGTLPAGFSWRGEDNQYKIVAIVSTGLQETDLF